MAQWVKRATAAIRSAPIPPIEPSAGPKKLAGRWPTVGRSPIVVAPANVTDHFLLEKTIEAIMVERSRPTEKEPQHLCLDAGYDNQASRGTVKEHHYQGHIRPMREEQPSRKGKKQYPPRR